MRSEILSGSLMLTGVSRNINTHNAFVTKTEKQTFFRETYIAAKLLHADDMGSSSNLNSASHGDQIFKSETLSAMAP